MAQLGKDNKEKERENRRISLADSLYISALFLMIDGLVDMVEALPVELPTGVTKTLFGVGFIFFAIYLLSGSNEKFFQFFKRRIPPISDLSFRPILIFLMFYFFFFFVVPFLLI